MAVGQGEAQYIIILDMDSMVLDNNDAKMRHGVSCTYKKVKGFHPFHISWNGYILILYSEALRSIPTMATRPRSPSGI